MGNKTNVVYAVSPALVFGYDALNRATNMVDAVGASALTYNSAGLLATEDGPWASDTVTYSYANRMRTGFSLQAPNASDWWQSYAYDSAKRLTSLTSPAGTFGYNYVGSCGCPAGSLVNRLTLPNGSFITNNFDGMARLMDTTLRNGGGTAQSSRAYTYNLASWRVSETRLDGSFVNYGYDNIGQLTNAVGKEAGGVTNRLHESYAYAYDKAGNLAARTNNALVQSFGVNSKNELTSITRSGTLTVAGFTTASANSVTVNGTGATRYTDWTFAKSGLTVTNGNNTFSAIATDTLGRADTNTVNFNLPATISYIYDGNGNLTSDGTRGLDYDDENQLIRVTVTNNWKTEFVYDGQQRRRIRKEYIWQSSAWALAAEVRYIFDGNLEIQQRDANNLPILTLTRGRDLGGGLENAGGIGGLLARTDHSSFFLPHSYFFSDGNGNVIALVNANQLAVAKYLYDSFGNTISSSGPLADVNTYRFSSKELHVPSGLIYFGRRFYDPNLQRWVNKDPIGIKGGINLFGYVKNAPVSNFDPFGLLTINIREFTHLFSEAQNTWSDSSGGRWVKLGVTALDPNVKASKTTFEWFNFVAAGDKGNDKAYWKCGFTKPNAVYNIWTDTWTAGVVEKDRASWQIGEGVPEQVLTHERLHQQIYSNYLKSTVGEYEKRVAGLKGAATTKDACKAMIEDQCSVLNKEYAKATASLFLKMVADQQKIDQYDTFTKIEAPIFSHSGIVTGWINVVVPEDQIEPSTLYFNSAQPTSW